MVRVCRIMYKCKAIALPCGGLNDLELDGYSINTHTVVLGNKAAVNSKLA